MMAKKSQMISQDFQIKPKPREKFKPSKCREIVQDILQAKLKGQQYNNDIPNISREIADSVKYKMKESGFSRYKFVTHVLIGQQKGTQYNEDAVKFIIIKGQGVRVGTRCFWDYETDYCVSESFTNDSIFCLVTVYAVYLY